MKKSTTFAFRVNPDVKQKASDLYESMGITLSDAINLFLYQSIREGGLPFELKKMEPKDEELK